MLKKQAFIIVGLGKYEIAASRLYRQAKRLCLSMDVLVINEFDLNLIYTEENISTEFINVSNRGFGFWMWKPIVINFYLRKYNQIFYIDAGSELVQNSFLNVIKWFDNSSYDMILSHSGHSIISYTKMETISEFFNETEFDEIKNNQMLSASIILIKKTKDILQIFSTLFDIVRNNRVDLFDDKYRTKFRDISFIEHRHDQSVFNLIVYKLFPLKQIVLLPSALTPPSHNLGFYANTPILCLRNISFVSYNEIYLMYKYQNKFPLFLRLLSRFINIFFFRFRILHNLIDNFYTKVSLLYTLIFHKKIYLNYKIRIKNKESYDNWVIIPKHNIYF